MVAEGTFREDLFYRINVIPVRLPALRERQSTTSRCWPSTSWPRFAAQMGKPITGISGAAMACLKAYAWPGNIRELENAMERAVALERTPSILVESLPDQLRGVLAAVARGGRRAVGAASRKPASTSSSTSSTSSANTSPRPCGAPAASRSRRPSSSA